MREILPFIIIGLIIVFSFFMIFLNLHNEEKKFREKIKLNSFFNYKENNPTLVKDGYVKCNVCGGSAIVIVYKYAPYDSDKPYALAHVCRTCGTTLYYTEND
jgi:hypothetical protein|nr:hypothetical protein [uncultured Haemophilus sp.]